MKLRNKKTGEIIKPYYVELTIWHDHETPEGKEFNSLAELNAEWEDYTPQEPLIKDEKIRKAVRAWAEANEFYTLRFVEENTHIAFVGWSKGNYGQAIEFPLGKPISIDNIIKNMTTYTIAELCGEEDNA